MYIGYYKMISQNETLGHCIVCKDELNSVNTKVIRNPKYFKYKNLVCNRCFDEYYPQGP